MFNGLEPFKTILKREKVSKTRMAQMWCELNRYQVPKEFKNELTPFKAGSSQRAQIAMKDIENEIGIEYCLKHWKKEMIFL